MESFGGLSTTQLAIALLILAAAAFWGPSPAL